MKRSTEPAAAPHPRLLLPLSRIALTRACWGIGSPGSRMALNGGRPRDPQRTASAQEKSPVTSPEPHGTLFRR